MQVPATPMTGDPAAQRDRIVVLDVLRGLALLGMFVVHIWDAHGKYGSRLEDFIGSAIGLLVDNKAYSIFAILFGAGFAIQLRQAQKRGERFIPRFLRRLLGLAAFGFVAQGIFGYNVLIGYAIWGVPLLVVWRWSTRALLITVVLCAMSLNLYNIAAFSYRAATLGVQGGRQANAQLQTEYRVARDTISQATSQASFSTLVKARLRFMKSFHAQPFSFTPWSEFVMFLLGLLALRLGLWECPREHWRLILAVMGFGLLSWVLARWVLPFPWPRVPIEPPDGSIGIAFRVFLISVKEGFRLFRGGWLALTYIGAVLLMVASDPRWERRLKVFALAGRMALTNYMIQIALIDVLFLPYGLGLHLRPELVPLAALALFGALVAFSWWWLQRFQLGPAEWVLRSITYARLEPIRVAHLVSGSRGSGLR